LSLTRGPPLRFCLYTRQLGRHFNIHDVSSVQRSAFGVVEWTSTLIALLIAVVIAALIIWFIVPRN